MATKKTKIENYTYQDFLNLEFKEKEIELKQIYKEQKDKLELQNATEKVSDLKFDTTYWIHGFINSKNLESEDLLVNIKEEIKIHEDEVKKFKVTNSNAIVLKTIFEISSEVEYDGDTTYAVADARLQTKTLTLIDYNDILIKKKKEWLINWVNKQASILNNNFNMSYPILSTWRNANGKKLLLFKYKNITLKEFRNFIKLDSKDKNTIKENEFIQRRSYIQDIKKLKELHEKKL